MQNLHIQGNSLSAQKKLEKRQGIISERLGKGGSEDFSNLFKINKFDVDAVSRKNCENLIGSVEIPVGAAGPVKFELKIKEEESAKREVVIPLATTEGVLIASVSRGCKVLNQGNLRVFVGSAGMTRAPVFRFGSHAQALQFVKWLEEKKTFQEIKTASEETSNHLKLNKYQAWVVGRAVYVRFNFDTDQAMGMNMVTLALKHVWDKVIKNYAQIELISISGNMCADKKQTAVNRLLGRGYEVQAEAFLDNEALDKVLGILPDQLLKAHYWKNEVGSRLAGAEVSNMHAANMTAAIFLATGQDMAHVVEAAQADLILEPEGDGLYAAVRMPNVNIGVVGGGTYLPAFKEARQLIFNQEIRAEELAGVVGAAVLAGELSGLAALASSSLAKAHQELAR